MKSHHVILPIRKAQKLDANYARVFHYLNARQATVHLVVINDHTPIIYSDSAALRAQQQQVHKMTQFLKFEMLDRLAIDLQEIYPSLTFEYHVEIDPLNRVIAKLREQFDAQMLIVDQRCLQTTDLSAEDRAIQYLISMLEMPIWLVGSDSKEAGDVAIAVDLPAHNIQVDQLNRTLLFTGSHFATDLNAKAKLVHGWQASGEQFMRSWLQLTDIDVARYARIERQQRESQLQEYVADARLTTNIQVQIVDGQADEVIAQFCEKSNIGLLVIGHSQNPYGPMGHVAADVVSNVNCDIVVMPQNVSTSQLFMQHENHEHVPYLQKMS